MSVFLDLGVDDYVTPAAACINPLFAAKSPNDSSTKLTSDNITKKEEQSAAGKTSGSAKISIDSGVFSGLDATQSKSSSSVQPISKKNKGLILENERKAARVTLNDCLACSGCVTSAESVLIESQGTEMFAKSLERVKSEPNTRIVVSLSPQSVASFAVRYNLTTKLAHQVLSTYFKSIGVSSVYSTQGGNDVALLETAAEFVARYQDRAPSTWVKPPDSVADSSIASHCPKTGRNIPLPRLDVEKPFTASSASSSSSGSTTISTNTNEVFYPQNYNQLPMLASSCPGWICYAEKTHPQSIPYISTCRSPQQIIGRVVKGSITLDQNIKNEIIIHVTVMPCFDKKLEASRKDFFEADDEPDVNFVLSTTEVVEMLNDSSFDVVAAAAIVEGSKSERSKGDSNGGSNIGSNGNDIFETIFAPHFPSSGGGSTSSLEESMTAVTFNNRSGGLGSGGYLDYTFRYAARRLFNVTIDEGPLKFIATKNPDFQYTELKVKGEVVLKFARAYGFRSIQAVVRQLKRKKCKYDYIEIMACPSGCLNGGGQLRGENSSETKMILSATKEKYHEKIVSTSSSSTTTTKVFENVFDPFESPACQYVYTTFLKNSVPFLSKNCLRELHTQYHAVAKLEDIAPMLVKW
jgi:iron only hydrogenase large subunit-like protein